MTNRTKRLLLVMAVLLVGLPLLGTGFNRLIQPQRHAGAESCFSGAANLCDKAIVAAICARGDAQDRNTDPCAFQRLEPGATFTEELAASGAAKRYTMACAAPFIPNWGPSLSNAAIQQKRCRRPDAVQPS